MSDIEDFLEKARSEGTLHSEGSFSIDADRAKRLLETYQFSDPNWYLLKLVQAAVACGASEMNITFRSDCVQVIILGNNMLLIQTKDILEMMLQREQFHQGALKQLAIGLNAALAKSPERVEWSVWNPFLQEVLTLNQQGSSLDRLRQRPHCLQEVGARSFYQFSLYRTPVPANAPETKTSETWAQKLTSWLHKKAPQIEQTMDEHHSLSEKCQFAPIVIRVDGRRVNQPDKLRNTVDGDGQIGFEASLLHIGPNSIGIGRFDPHPRTPHRQLRLENASDCLVESKNPRWTKALFSGHLTYPTTSFFASKVAKLFLVHYGVTLEELPYQSAYPSMNLVMSSEGLSVDLSEQSVIKNELLERRLSDIADLIQTILEQAAPRPGWNDDQYRRSAASRFASKLTHEIEPFFAPIPASLVPDDPLLDIGATNNGLLTRLSRIDNSKVKLELPDPGVGHLHSPAKVWPNEPPGEPDRWLEWVKGAICCVAQNDFYRFNASNLTGPYIAPSASPDQEGVMAEFWPDGQLRTLYYQSEGQKVGWILSLAQAQLSGKVTHAKDNYEEIFLKGQVHSNSLKPQPEIWHTWVSRWIEAVYRDALW